MGVEYGTGAYRVVRWKLVGRWGRGEVQRDVGSAERKWFAIRRPGRSWTRNSISWQTPGIANLENGKIDPKKLEPLHIAVVTLR